MARPCDSPKDYFATVQAPLWNGVLTCAFGLPDQQAKCLPWGSPLRYRGGPVDPDKLATINFGTNIMAGTRSMKCWRLPRVTLTLLAVGALTKAQAQTQQLPPIGARLRVFHDSSVEVGTLRAVDSGRFLVLAMRGRDTSLIALSSISGLDVSVGRKAHAARGAIIGGLLGALAGFVTAATVSNSSAPNGEPFNNAPVLGVGAILAVAFGLPAAGIGAVVGESVKTDHWVPIR